MEVKIGRRMIKVTDREIDILACLLHGRGVKKTAQLLHISPKTVDAHVHNLMVKLECNGREAIIDLLENSDFLEIMKERYHQIIGLTSCTPTEIECKKKKETPPLSQFPSVDTKRKNLKGKLCLEDSMAKRRRGREASFTAGLLNFLVKKFSHFKTKKKLLIGGLFCVSCVSMAFLIKNSFHRFNNPRFSVKSEIVLPHEGVFLQRITLLNKMKKKLKGREGIQKLILLGPGGSGKTTLARYYMQAQKSSLSWEINAEGPLQLLLSLSQLAQALAQEKADTQALREIQALKDFSQKEQKLLTYLKEKLRQQPGWLLLFDNVLNFSDVKKYLPSDSTLWGSGKILITTQNATVGLHDYIPPENIIKVEELTAEEKEHLFKKILSIPSTTPSSCYTQEQLRKFLEKLPPFPLDISTAAYYIKLTSVPYSQYLKHIEASYKDVSEIQENILKDVSHYTKTRYSIISLSLQQIMQISKDFAGLLVFISLVDSQHIPKALLDLCMPTLSVDKFIYHLKKYSLINQEGVSPDFGSLFSLHRSTQEASLAYLTKALELESNHPLIHAISTCIESYLSSLIEEEDTSKMKYLLSHGEKILSHKLLFKEQAQGVIGSKLGGMYFYLGYYPQAKKQLEIGFQALQQEEKKNFHKILWVLEYLSDVYNDTGNYHKAKTLLEESLALIKKYSPSLKGREASIFERLGNVHNGIGNYDQARKLLEQALYLYKKGFPKRHEGLARTLARLAITYRELGEFSKAKALDNESLTLYQKYFPHNQVRRARQLASLGYTYYFLEDYLTSKKLLEESLNLYKQELPPDHIYTIWATIFLGNTYKQLGNTKKAKDLIEKGLGICQQHYGKDHVKVAEVLRDLGDLYLQEGNLEKGEAILLTSLAIFRKHNHPHAYTSLEHLAKLYEKKSRYQEGKDNMVFQELARKTLRYLEEALKIFQAHFPSDSPHGARIQTKLEKWHRHVYERNLKE